MLSWKPNRAATARLLIFYDHWTFLLTCFSDLMGNSMNYFKSTDVVLLIQYQIFYIHLFSEKAHSANKHILQTNHSPNLDISILKCLEHISLCTLWNNLNKWDVLWSYECFSFCKKTKFYETLCCNVRIWLLLYIEVSHCMYIENIWKIFWVDISLYGWNIVIWNFDELCLFLIHKIPVNQPTCEVHR